MSSCSLSDIYYEGFLEKQRRVKAWSWKAYWFLLEGDELSYYKDKERKISRGLIDLAQAKTVRACAAPSKGFPFEIVTSSRSHTLSAKTAELRDKWVGLCEKALLLSFRRSKSMHRPSCDSISDEDLPDSVLQDLQKVSVSGSLSSSSSEYSAKYNHSQSMPNTPVAPRPSRASRSHSNEEHDTQETRSLAAKSRSHRFCKKAKSEFIMVPSSPQPEKTALKASRSNTSSSSMSTEDDDVFSGTPPQAQVAPNMVLLRRNVQPLGRLKVPSEGSSSSSSKWGSTVTSVSSNCNTVENIADDDAKSSISSEDEDDDHDDDEDDDDNVTVPLHVYQSGAVLLQEGPLSSINFTPSSIPPLPYPRLELVNKSIEDLRGCIARIRKPNEIFAKPHPAELGGKAMVKLREFLSHLDDSKSNGSVKTTL